ncbi:MAG: AraC family transcriptional regulator [Paludibacteraceae bacterium]|nr:AraC family transcriptional regulator [Paludibacteraceae bacterium]
MIDEKRIFEEAFRTIEQKEIAVLRNVRGYPVYHRDIVSPYLMIFVCHSGSARALYDMTEIVFSANEIALILPNHIIHSLESSPDYNVTVILHSSAFEQEMNNRQMTHDRNKFHTLPACRLKDDEIAQYMKAVDLLEIISQTPVARYPHRHDMLIALTDVMKDMLDACRREMDENTLKTDGNRAVFRSFCHLLAQHYREQHEVAFYAENAHLTTRHFSVIIKENIGITASDYIKQYIAMQAKNILLSRPDLSVQQIGYYLGFAEPPSFCRFFKHLTGMTPKQYKEHSIGENGPMSDERALNSLTTSVLHR